VIHEGKVSRVWFPELGKGQQNLNRDGQRELIDTFIKDCVPLLLPSKLALST
jgi:hypothetical protein